MSKSMRVAMSIAFLAVMAVVCSSSALAQDACAAFYVPPASESGNFITGKWYAEGDAILAHQQVYVKISVQDYGGMGVGKKQHVYKGKEAGFYDFGNGDTFRTSISYVVEHFNDSTKWYLNAVETIVPDSGTGRFAEATGHFTDHGTFGVSNWATMDGWSLFTKHGEICGIE